LRNSAQIGLCDAKIRALAKNIFDASDALARLPAGCARESRAHDVETTRAAACETKALKKSAFVERRSRATRVRPIRNASTRRTTCRQTPGRPGAARENNCLEVLTPEKTVIRFRPADATCGRE